MIWTILLILGCAISLVVVALGIVFCFVIFAEGYFWREEE